ncbi:MAG: exodeoxyribonuclease III [Anaerovorax sp.]
MKIITWNVNGLRACLGKGFIESCQSLDGDVICLQETKMQEGQAVVDLEGYEQYWNSAEKKGYSGTAIFTRIKPLNVTFGLEDEKHNKEGRVITAEFEDFFLVNQYVPNSKEGLARIEYRMEYEDAVRAHICKLDGIKPVIICGDFNVAPEEIDLKNPKPNRGSAGFSDEERDKFRMLLRAGFKDSFRELYPHLEGAYSWWSYRFKARANNAGWRIDHFVVSERMLSQVEEVCIHAEIMGSDHCPVLLEGRL